MVAYKIPFAYGKNIPSYQSVSFTFPANSLSYSAQLRYNLASDRWYLSLNQQANEVINNAKILRDVDVFKPLQESPHDEILASKVYVVGEEKQPDKDYFKNPNNFLVMEIV